MVKPQSANSFLDDAPPGTSTDWWVLPHPAHNVKTNAIPRQNRDLKTGTSKPGQIYFLTFDAKRDDQGNGAQCGSR